MTRRLYNPDVVASRIKSLRKKYNLTQADLASKTGISLNTIKCYESSSATKKRVPDNYNLNILSKTLKVDTDYILGGSDYCNKWDKYDSTHQAQANKIKSELKLYDYCEYIGYPMALVLENEEDDNRFISAINKFISEQYKIFERGSNNGSK